MPVKKEIVNDMIWVSKDVKIHYLLKIGYHSNMGYGDKDSQIIDENQRR
jgi:hypothetical protein